MRMIRRFVICLSFFVALLFKNELSLANCVLQDDIEFVLETDKDSYSKNEQINAKLYVKNNNTETVKSIIVKFELSKGFSLVEDPTNNISINDLSSGEKCNYSISIIKTVDSLDSSEKKENEKSEDDIDSKGKTKYFDNRGINKIHLIIIVVIIIILIIIIILLVIKKSNSSAKRTISIIICMSLTGSMFGYSNNYVLASDDKSVSISKKVMVDGTELVIKALVSYIMESDGEDKGLAYPKNPTEADKYYWDNSKVMSIMDVDDADNVFSEKEIVNELTDRGFIEYPITYDFTIDGEYCNETEISDPSDNNHPMYETFYVTEKGDVFTISVIGKAIIANPVTYNLESELQAEVLVAETINLTSYDDENNRFYITEPNDTVVLVKTIERVDSETLEKISLKRGE